MKLVRLSPFRWAASSLNSLEKGNDLQMVILKKQLNEFIGCAGLHQIGAKDPELGIWIKKSAHGKNMVLKQLSL